MRQCLTLALIISMVHISLSQFRVKIGLTLSDLRLKENFYPKDLGFDRSVTLGPLFLGKQRRVYPRCQQDLCGTSFSYFIQTV